METALQRLLCREKWYWDSNQESYVKFSEDGTGQLVARRELQIFIAAYFTWKPQSDSLRSLNNTINPSSESQSDAQLLHTIAIEIQLSKRRVQDAAIIDIDRYQINEDILSETAFSSNTYTLRIEKGKFMGVEDARLLSKLPYFCYYSYRLLFDTSPFPPRHLWKGKEMDRALEKYRFWEWQQFLSGRLPVEKNGSLDRGR